MSSKRVNNTNSEKKKILQEWTQIYDNEKSTLMVLCKYVSNENYTCGYIREISFIISFEL